MKIYMFRTVPLSIIRSISLYTQQWYMSYSLWAGSGRSFLILLASCRQTCMIYTIAVCTVKNSWWWTVELSETCRVSFQNKFEKLVHLAGFIIRICPTKYRRPSQIQAPHHVQRTGRLSSWHLPYWYCTWNVSSLSWCSTLITTTIITAHPHPPAQSFE